MNRYLTIALALAVGLSACKHKFRSFPGDASGGLPDAGGLDVEPDVGTDAGFDSAPMLQCGEGIHVCAETCVRNDSTRTCGTSCTPCQAPIDGTATCDGTSCGATCAAGKQLCNGACIDTGTTCAGGCASGTHACGGLCPSLTDVNACGTSCVPCAMPTGALQATCDGQKCDFQCMTGFHRCAEKCVRDDDVTACGSSCQACPGSSNGAARCIGGTCTVVCNTSYHACGGACVSETSPDSCGASCNPCPAVAGGTVTCLMAKCGGSCPTGQKLCNGACIDMNASCSGMCPMGTHDCGGICAANNSPNSCGTSCSPCPRPTGAVGTSCNGTTCDFTCGPGYHRCGTRCAPDDDATACGAACAVCPPDANGLAVCQNASCGLMCNMGFHQCGSRCVNNKDVANCGPTSCVPCMTPSGGTVTCTSGVACEPSCPMGMKLCNGACIDVALACNGMCPMGTHNCSESCVSNSNPNSCGTSCSPCPAPANGTATCNGTMCGIMCQNGLTNCGGMCVNTASDPLHCGTCPTMCPVPMNGTATCTSGVCGVTCPGGTFACRPASGAGATSCAPDHWDFENGAIQGFMANTATDDLTVVTSPTHNQSRYALSASYANLQGAVTIVKNICNLVGTPNLDGRTLSGYLYVNPPLLPGAKVQLTIRSSSGTLMSAQMIPADTTTWILLSVLPPASALVMPDQFGVQIDPGNNAGIGWTGTVYLDDFSWR